MPLRRYIPISNVPFIFSGKARFAPRNQVMVSDGTRKAPALDGHGAREPDGPGSENDGVTDYCSAERLLGLWNNAR